MDHSSFFPDSFHRVTIKGLCVRDGKLLLAKERRIDGSDGWEMPGGGLDFGEDIKEALKREVKEEMGLRVTKISEKPLYVWTHKYEKNRRGIDWYYSLVIAYRVEFADLNITPSDECEAVEFFSKEELKNIPLNGQSKELEKIFDPEDFKEQF